MKDLNRLLDEQGTDPLEADLLRLARSEGPSGESRRRILTGLGVAIAAGTVSQSSAAATQGTVNIASRSALKWAAGSSVVVAAGVVAYLLLGHHAPKAQPAQVSTPAAALTVAPVSEPAAAPAAPVTADSAQVTKLEDLPTLPDSSASDASHSAAAPSLADEVAAIKSAKSLLAAGNAAQSLHELDAYRAHFPHGRLTQEASVVRIEALLKSGNQAAATAAADRFLAAHSDSPYAARVHTLIGH